MNVLKNKTILITGGTGSFGQQFTKIVLDEYQPNVVRIFSRGEMKQFEMKKKFQHPNIRYFIGDVRDKERLHRAMAGVDIVVHAAALKQVPACEYNPIEAIRTNVEGAINIIDTAIDNGVEYVMALSTDKAVHPVNLYGATKMTAEKLFIQANTYSGLADTKFSCVRYGNVIGSRGSVIPLFEEQKKTGTITLTDDRMTRFWITLESGARFSINSINKMKGGEIFVPKIPSMSLLDLANVIAPKAKKEVIGIRPGEKLHETLLTEDEARHSKEFDNYYVIESEQELPYESKRKLIGSKPLFDGFKYTSDTNSQQLTKKEILKITKRLNS